MAQIPTGLNANTPDHAAAHIILHTLAGGLPTNIKASVSRYRGGGDRSHLAAHKALKSWYDLSHPGSPLPEVVDVASHILAHELLHAWVNSFGLGQILNTLPGFIQTAAASFASSSWPPAGLTFTDVATYPSGSGFGGSYFPTGVWLADMIDPADRAIDESANLNLYIGLTTNSSISMATANGAKVLAQWSQTGWPNPTLEWANSSQMTPPGNSVATGWVMFDELDMFGGSMAEDNAFLNNVESILSGRGDNRIQYYNWGKGVAFWNNNTDAASYVNRGDIACIDTYWYTDPNIAGPGEGGHLLNNDVQMTNAQTRLACNYARIMDRMHILDKMTGGVKPIWNFVEVGRPWSESVAQNSPTTTPDHIRGAVWQSVIAGALGIGYFNHSFSTDGSFVQTSNCIREGNAYATQRAAVAEVNLRLHQLANVLHSPTVTGYLSSTALRTLVKYYQGYWYIFAGSIDGTTGVRAMVNLVDHVGSTAEVLYESRTVPITAGSITDTFAEEWSTHIYKVQASQ